MLKIGILGAARIAPEAIILPAQRRDDVEIVAVAASRAGAAQAFAKEHGIARSYDNYTDLIADPDIDLIYNALPPSRHADLAIEALHAGKHVLCEKPFAMNVGEVRTMQDAADATGKRLIEAFHDRYHPIFVYLMGQKASGRLGSITGLRAVFNHTIPFSTGELRHVPELGGGALMDLGCYTIHWCRCLMESEPQVTDARSVTTETGVDEATFATLAFDGGVEASIEAQMGEGWDLHCEFEVTTDRGHLTLINNILPHKGHCVLENLDGVFRQFTLAGKTSYDHQLDHLVQALATGEPMLTEAKNQLGNMQVIDAIYSLAGVR